MARCPNCDRETVRTKDWVCLHCGYPLISGSYTTIDNTYRELKEMVESGQMTVEEIGRKPAQKAKPVPAPKQRPQPPVERKPSEESAGTETPKPAARSLFGRPKQQPAAERKTEPPQKIEPAPITRPAATRPSPTQPPPTINRATPSTHRTAPTPTTKSPSPTPQAQTTPIPQSATKAAPAQESATPNISKTPPFAKPEPAPEARLTPTATPAQPTPDIKPTPASAPTQPVLEITVAELISTYETEGPTAEAKFTGKIIRLTGAIDRINVRDALNIYQIILNSPKKNVLLQGVRCVFDKSRAAELTKLAPGQNVTIQGKYDGSIIDISLRDCVLVG